MIQYLVAGIIAAFSVLIYRYFTQRKRPDYTIKSYIETRLNGEAELNEEHFQLALQIWENAQMDTATTINKLYGLLKEYGINEVEFDNLLEAFAYHDSDEHIIYHLKSNLIDLVNKNYSSK